MIGIIGNILAGVISGFIVLGGQYLSRRWRLRKEFKPLEGDYEMIESTSAKHETASWTMRYIEGNVLETSGGTDSGEWRGRMCMNELMPEFGSGRFRYLDNDAWGIHQIQVDKVDSLVHVFTQDRGYGGQAAVSYVLRKCSDPTERS